MLVLTQSKIVVYAWIFSITCALSLLSLALGMDANWDLRNYHYYLAYAFLQHRYEYDVLAAQLPTFFNPLLDIPFFLAAERFSARLVGGWLGAMHAVPFTILLLLARRILAVDNLIYRTHAAGLIALVSVSGAIALSEVGTVFYDNLLATGFLVSLLIVITTNTKSVQGQPYMTLKRAFFSGIPVGFAAALKLPHAIAVFGVCTAILVLPGQLPRRLVTTASFIGGTVVSIAVTGGWWHWYLWQKYGNPVFPAFNNIFQSPWAEISSYRGNTFLPGDFLEQLIAIFSYPFFLEKTAEVPLQDLRIATFFLLFPIAVIFRLRKKTFIKINPLVHSLPALCLLTAVTSTYLAWAIFFAIYRYAVGLEMLIPLALIIIISWIPVPKRWLVSIVVLFMLIVKTSPANWGRVPWTERYLEVQGIPNIRENSMILMSGREALSFLIPAFPPQVRFIRIDSWFTTPWQDNGFTRLVYHEVNTHRGELFMLLVGYDYIRARETATVYGLSLEETDCTTLTASIATDVYQLCRLKRLN